MVEMNAGMETDKDEGKWQERGVCDMCGQPAATATYNGHCMCCYVELHCSYCKADEATCRSCEVEKHTLNWGSKATEQQDV